MRILHISYTTRYGAGKALLRHHRALVKAGVDSHLLLGDRVVQATERIHHLEPAANLRQASLRIVNSSLFQQADVIELRQLHRGRQPSFFNLRALRDMAIQKPVVWRLSDAWAFSGFCAYFFDCQQWESGCVKCPLAEHPERSEIRVPSRSSCARMWRMKRSLFQQISLNVVSPSHWLLDAACRSSLSQGNTRFHHIPVGVDTQLFDGKGRDAQRQRLGIAPDSVVALINAPDVKNYRKGCDLLVDALGRLNKRSVVLLVIGKDVPKGLELQGISIRSTGYLDDDHRLAEIYAAADMFLFPSRQDNSAQVLLEAAASRLPVVAFNVGGNGEYVENGRTGFVVPPNDCSEFACATEQLLDDAVMRSEFGRAGQCRAQNGFDLHHQAERFGRLYESMLSNRL